MHLSHNLTITFVRLTHEPLTPTFPSAALSGAATFDALDLHRLSIKSAQFASWSECPGQSRDNCASTTLPINKLEIFPALTQLTHN